MLLFYHDAINGGLWPSAEAAKWKENSPYLYSIISKFTTEYQTHNKYQFLLEYPSLNTHIIWRQSLSPLNETTDQTNTKVDGFQPIHVESQELFSGLAKAKHGTHLIDGTSISGIWHYAIGVVSSSYSPKIPGPVYDGDREVFVNDVALWVRFPIQGDCTCKTTNRMFYSPLILIELIV